MSVSVRLSEKFWFFVFCFDADCKKKLDACKKKTEEAYSNVEAGNEIERLQKELDEEMELECKLKDQLR